ncbi:methyltransferase [Alcanivorax sp. 1008]|uniref:class I SAM-dependent methyltransferase n=1 Tax=Alcanivorax sp. 1008 TaxID=2816853 RepID=UPI001E0A1C02|nr:50S ribosomal protein L11 methyltransferase [Alcanivorax sp. 1008]MCC1497259.1 50S ribosomal protein L11 methyltransferase [Alcanivorax sp. 1008]
MSGERSIDPSAGDVRAQLQAELRQLLPEATLRRQAPPLIPELPLWLLADIQAGQRLEASVAGALMETPPYWSFCWASGQVLARWLLDHADQVRGRTVVDVGPGSGVVALAAALAGAGRVIACDIDPQALLAVTMNARALSLAVELSDDLHACLPQADLVTAADILYDRDNLPMLKVLQVAPWVLLADSRVRNLSSPGYQQVSRFSAVTWPDLGESSQFNQVTVYQSRLS